MPLNPSDSFSSFDAATNRRLDISPVLSTILLNDTATLGLIGQGPAVMRAEHKFGEDSLNPPSVVLTADAAAGAGSITVDDTSKLRVGALLMDELSGKTEIIQVVTITSATTADVNRGYGGTPDEDHLIAASSTLAIVGQPVQVVTRRSRISPKIVLRSRT